MPPWIRSATRRSRECWSSSTSARVREDTIVGKALWPRLEATFGSKEALATKLDQLAELRNGIRHSRTISEITRKEGEASLLWFTEVLGR